MSVVFPHDCLAYQMTKPLLRHQSLEAVPCSTVAKLLTEFRATQKDHAKPEEEALTFYQLSHAMSLIQQRRHPHEPLPADELSLVQEYFDLGGLMSQRALYYLILICQRETRHLHDKTAWKTPITDMFGAAAYSYIASLPDGPSQAMEKFTKSPPKTTLGPYLKALSHVFYKGSWSSGYGGKKWGVVTDCAVDFVTGKYSAAMMVDTIWTLSHNGGPIFNKGMLYSPHSSNHLVQILDVQRAGMIPTFIDTPHTPWGSLSSHVKPHMLERNAKIRAIAPELPTTLDFAKISELGAVLPWAGHASKPYVKAKPPFPTYAFVPPKETTHWYVYDNLWLKKIEVLRAA